MMEVSCSHPSLQNAEVHFHPFSGGESSPTDKHETDRISFLHQGLILPGQGGTGLCESQRKGNGADNTRGDNLRPWHVCRWTPVPDFES